MNTLPPNSVLFTVAFFLAGVSASAQDFRWDSGGSNTKYETAENWSSNQVPYSTGDSTMYLMADDGGTVTFGRSTGTRSIDYMNLGNGSTLNMTGGAFDHAKSGNVVRTVVGTSGTGSTVNQSGGKMSIGHLLKIGDKRASGRYNLSGGELNIFRGGRTLVDAPTGASISLMGRQAELNLIGGLLETRFGVEIDSGSRVRVHGRGMSAIKLGSVKRDDSGSWYQKGTLSYGIGSEGVTTIQIIGGTNNTPFAKFILGSKLDLGFNSGTRPVNGTWTLLELENQAIVDEGLVLSAATTADPKWGFNIDNSGPNGRLIATYGDYVSIPEPLNFSIALGACCLFVLNFRRKRS